MPNGVKKSGKSAHSNRQRSLAEQKWVAKMEEERSVYEIKMKELDTQRVGLNKTIRELHAEIVDGSGNAKEVVILREEITKLKTKLNDRGQRIRKLEEEWSQQIRKNAQTTLKIKDQQDAHDSFLSMITEKYPDDAQHFRSNDGDGKGIKGFSLNSQKFKIKCRLCSNFCIYDESTRGFPLIKDEGRICSSPECLKWWKMCCDTIGQKEIDRMEENGEAPHRYLSKVDLEHEGRPVGENEDCRREGNAEYEANLEKDCPEVKISTGLNKATGKGVSVIQIGDDDHASLDDLAKKYPDLDFTDGL